MCEATTIIALTSMALSAGGAVMQNRASVDQAERTAEHANEVGRREQSAITEQKRQRDIALNQEKFDRQRQGLRERGLMNAILGDKGATGVSAQRSIVASLVDEAINLGTIDTSRDFGTSASVRALSNSMFTTQNRIDSALASAPSELMQAFSIVSSGAQGFATGQSIGEGLKDAGLFQPKKTVTTNTGKEAGNAFILD